jgi:O-acetyl-ADP-ribose deacetylase (regulator of RNase III)
MKMSLTMNGSFAGIGSRQTTHKIALFLYRLGFALSLRNIKCLTGGAPGSDDAFEKGVRLANQLLSDFEGNSIPLFNRLKVFLPWEGFNYRFTNDPINTTTILPEAFTIASKTHPGWKYFKEKSPIKPLMARNSHQVLGSDLGEPVRFVFCYTSDGVSSGQATTDRTGGTGQAIRLASSRGIPVYNIGNRDHYLRAEKFVQDVFDDFGKFFSTDLFEYTHQKFISYMPFQRRIEGDLVDAALNGEVEAIIHGCNCWNTMSSGLAKRIRDEFYEAYQADCLTKKGDKSKLGKYSYAVCQRNGRPILVINAYTQYKYGRAEELYSDYDAIRDVCKLIKKDFPNTSFGVPRIGAGLANGSWITVSDIVANELGKSQTTLYDFDPGTLDAEPALVQRSLDI